MAGIYFHIPFCKQACHYCDFHFSTSLKYRNEMLDAMCRELALQSNYLAGQEQPIETIYFGGGTPSLLSASDIDRLIGEAAKYFVLQREAEITIEANPDDLGSAKVHALKGTAINRFSIGIQSFFEEDLRWMNRAHNAEEAENAIKRVQDAGYSNITADLIYGYPLLSETKWQANISRLLDFDIPHISAYGMTIEPQTALAAFIRKGKQAPMDEGQSAAQFDYLMDALGNAGYIQYEISNFAKQGAYARHNSNYWRGVPYIGIGPSAHSFNGDARQWNIRNNASYIRSIKVGVVPCDREELAVRDKFNEYIMTSLRTSWGVDIGEVEKKFGSSYRNTLSTGIMPFVMAGTVLLEGNIATLTRKGKMLADHIASELFSD